LYGQTQLAWNAFFELQSEREPDRYSGARLLARFLAPFPTIHLRIARARRIFLLPERERFQRRAPELTMLVQEAFVRGLSMHQVGRVVATVTDTSRSARKAFLG